MTPKIRLILHCIGSILAIAGICFVSYRLKVYLSDPAIWSVSRDVLYASSVFIFIYGSINIFLCCAYRQLLVYFGIEIKLRKVIKIYGTSQLAKYVPGNIFHLASRQVLAAANNLSNKSVAKASALELGMLAICASTFSILIAPAYFPFFFSTLALFLFVIICGLLIAGTAIFLSISLAKAIGFYLLFFLVSGSIFSSVLVLVAPEVSLQSDLFTIAIGGFVVAWLIGFLTPGAPAGVGIRELILVLILGERLAESDVIISVVITRAINVLGDVFMYFIAIAANENKLASADGPNDDL